MSHSEPVDDSGIETEIVPADPGRQRAVLLGMALFCAVGVRGVHELGGAFDTIRALTRVDPDAARRRILTLLDFFLYGMSAILAVGALVLAVQGLRILRSGHFPPPGARVVLDTRVQRGAAAKRRGGLSWMMGTLMLLAAVALPTLGKREILERIYLPQDLDQDLQRIVDPDTPDVPLFTYDPLRPLPAESPTEPQEDGSSPQP